MFVNLKALAPVEDGPLRGTTRLVALEAAMHSDGQGRVTMSITDLACHTGLSRMTVTRALREIEAAGLLGHPRHGRYMFRAAAVSPQAAADDLRTELTAWLEEEYGNGQQATFVVMEGDDTSHGLLSRASAAGLISRLGSVAFTHGSMGTRYEVTRQAPAPATPTDR